MGWTLASAATSSVHEVLKYIAEHEDLEIFSIVNEHDWVRCTANIDNAAERISEALRAHPHKPWVFLDPIIDKGFDFLKPVFEKNGIKVVQGTLEFIIHERWCEQSELPDDGHNFRDGVETGSRDLTK
ncbi:MAG: hypothetical protein AAB586_01545 [Patescibacteria group bacterium]